MASTFDQDQLMEHIDGDLEFLEESIEILQEDGPALLAEIRAAIDAQDAEALVRPAHTLKGMLANFFAGTAKDAAADLERRAREDRLDGAAELLVELDAGLAQLGDELQAFVGARRE